MLPGLMHRLRGLHCKYSTRNFFSDIVIHCKMPIFQNKQISEEGFVETFSRNFHIFVFSIQSYIDSRIANYPLLGTFLLNALTGGQLVISLPIPSSHPLLCILLMVTL